MIEDLREFSIEVADEILWRRDVLSVKVKEMSS